MRALELCAIIASTPWARVEQILTILVVGVLLIEIWKLSRELTRLRSEKSIEAAKVVEHALLNIDVPTCPVCKAILILRFSTTFSNAIEALNNLETAVTTSGALLPVDMLKVLKVLGGLLTSRLWPHPIDHEGRASWQQDLTTQAMQVYAALTPHMSEASREEAIRFCIECCKGRGDLRREAVRLLLPVLFVDSRGDDPRLVEMYNDLLLTSLPSTNAAAALALEQKQLLTTVFSGLDKAALADSAKPSELWINSFQAITKDIERVWEKGLLGTYWSISMSNRLKYCTLAEKEKLRNLIADYIRDHSDLHQHTLAYHQIAQAAASTRASIDPTDRGFRPVNRAVVPQNFNMHVQVRPRGYTPAEARLINFSVESPDDRYWKRGAWVTGPMPQWPGPPAGDWWEATVLIETRQGKNATFKQAKVQGPITLGPNLQSCGFRIQLGSEFPKEEEMQHLKKLWKIWPKR